MKSGLLFGACMFVVIGTCCRAQSSNKRVEETPIVIDTEGFQPVKIPDAPTKPILWKEVEIQASKPITCCYEDLFYGEREEIPVFPLLRHPRRGMYSNAMYSGGGIETPQGTFSIRGSRNAPLIFVDNVKTRGSGYISPAAMEQITITWGAVPANIGDTDSGVIQISTRSVYR